MGPATKTVFSEPQDLANLYRTWPDTKQIHANAGGRAAYQNDVINYTLVPRTKAQLKEFKYVMRMFDGCILLMSGCTDGMKKHGRLHTPTFDACIKQFFGALGQFVSLTDYRVPANPYTVIGELIEQGYYGTGMTLSMLMMMCKEFKYDFTDLVPKKTTWGAHHWYYNLRGNIGNKQKS